jgi:hypothetical protein
MSDYKNITHNLKVLSESQKSDLEFAESLLNKINTSDYSKRDNWVQTSLRYDGEKFYPENGSYNTFLSDDVNKAIKKDLDSHLDFIYSIFETEILNFKKSSKNNRFVILNDKTSMLLEYYTDYPVNKGYSKQYSNASSDLKAKVENFLSENK